MKIEKININDLKRNQFKIFVDYAHKHNTRIHNKWKKICKWE